MKKFLCLALLLLAGCEPLITSGKVIGKNYYPPYETQESVVVGHVDMGDISIPIYVEKTVHHPEVYEIVIENEAKGKVVSRKVYVSKSTYDSYNDNDWMDLKND